MVLTYGDLKISEEIDLPTLYSLAPNLAVSGAKFAQIPCRIVDGGSEGVLYVRQKEDVVTYFGDRFDDGNSVKKLGTQDVLTCHVVALRHEVFDIDNFFEGFLL